MNPYMTLSIKIDFYAGTSIEQAATIAQALADEKECPVRFDFNGVDCTAYTNGSDERLALEQQAAQNFKPVAASK